MSTMTIPKGVERIDSCDCHEGVDDVAISLTDGQMYRLERMTNGSFWSCIYNPDGSRHVFWFYAKKGTLTVEHRIEAAP
jgi:hypothetical protein